MNFFVIPVFFAKKFIQQIIQINNFRILFFNKLKKNDVGFYSAADSVLSGSNSW